MKPHPAIYLPRAIRDGATDLNGALCISRAPAPLSAITVDLVALEADGITLRRASLTLGEIARGGVAQLIVVSKGAAGGDASSCDPVPFDSVAPVQRCAAEPRQLSGLRPADELVTTSSGRYACFSGNRAPMVRGAGIIDSAARGAAKTGGLDEPPARR